MGSFGGLGMGGVPATSSMALPHLPPDLLDRLPLAQQQMLLASQLAQIWQLQLPPGGGAGCKGYAPNAATAAVLATMAARAQLHAHHAGLGGQQLLLPHRYPGQQQMPMPHFCQPGGVHLASSSMAGSLLPHAGVQYPHLLPAASPPAPPAPAPSPASAPAVICRQASPARATAVPVSALASGGHGDVVDGLLLLSASALMPRCHAPTPESY
ncbi:hypothetical protein T492DRAFT_1063936, partial [Pavlovales sp. CCMP2436]